MEQKKLFPDSGGEQGDGDSASPELGNTPEDQSNTAEVQSNLPEEHRNTLGGESKLSGHESDKPVAGRDFDDHDDKRDDDEDDDEDEPSSRPADSAPADDVDYTDEPSRGAPSVPPPMCSMIAGAVLGGAIGDAMGHPTEFIGSMASIRSRFGPAGVTRFELYWDRGGKRFAPYTDDTQMAEIVLRTLIESRAKDEGLDATMEQMANAFIEWADHPQGGHRAPGNACLSGCRALARGVPWSEAGGAKAGGCGSVMRAYPFGLVFADDLRRAERWSVAHSKLTHRDPIALAACAAMAVGMARILRGEPVMTVASEMVAAACRYSPPTASMMAEAVNDAVSGVRPKVTLDRLRAWAAHEAIAAAVYIFVRHPDNVTAAILEGANTPGDSDSIATLAGAMVGARCGLSAIPEEWVRDVERSAELLELASRVSIEPSDRV